MSSRVALVVAAALVLVACSGPFVMFPGGALEGDAQPAPASWASVGEHGTAQLETLPADPYSVNIAYTVMDGVLYVNAGDTETRWVKNMTTDPNVRLRIDDALYELAAERVTDAREIAAFGRAWTSRSSFYRDPAELDEVWLYRMVAR